MINKELRETIWEMSEKAVILDNPSFDASIIGISTDGRVIYDLEKMVIESVENENMTEEEAREFIDQDTLRAIPFFGEYAPIIMDTGSVVNFEINGDE